MMYHPYQQEFPEQPRHRQSPSASSSESSYMTDNEKNKRKQSLEKNRLAAYRCRERKKTEQQQMVDHADFLTVENQSLQILVGNLRKDVIHLREMLLAHDTCDCESVHLFIQRSSAQM